MIVIKPPIYDARGNLKLDEDVAATDYGSTTRRLSRRPTIDGGVWIDDFGSSAGDKTLQIVAQVGRPDYERLVRFAQTYTLVEIVTRDGVFLGALSAISYSAELNFQFLVKEQVNA
ncbi:MAG: hypothetical protein RBS36_05795 [Thiomicrospira sp.]|jgi:hypothetical protein|nr:hypothetical protein [Thiomicrospira sp.]